MTRLVLVRHAPTRREPDRPAWRWPLADGAEERIAALAARLPPASIDGVLGSVEPKAIATGRALARRLGTGFRTVPGLHEHQRGTVPLLSDEAWREAVRRLFRTPDALVFGRETASEALARFERALASALADSPERAPAVVTHGTVMSLYLARHNDRDPFELWSGLGMPEAVVVRWPEGRIERRIAVDRPAA